MDTFDLQLWPGFRSAAPSNLTSAPVDQIVIDSRRIDSRQTLFVALKGEKDDGHHYLSHAARQGARYALIAQEWPSGEELENLILLRVPNPLAAFQDIVKTYRSTLKTQMIGIAGSFGKTMLKDLLYTLLSMEKSVGASPESFNSQIGVPLSLLTIKHHHELALIEAAVSQPNEMDTLSHLINPNYTIITPIGKKHLATLGSLSTIGQEVMKLAQATSSSGWTLLPQDPHLQAALPCPAYLWDTPSSLLPHASIKSGSGHIPFSYQVIFPDGSSYQGSIANGHTYLVSHINMAIKSAWLLGISAENIQYVLRHYQPEPMRMEMWKSPIGTVWIHDVYSADPQSVDRSIQHLDYAQPNHKRTFVFGGLRGHGAHLTNDYRRIGQTLQKTQLDRLVLFGNKTFTPLLEELEQHTSPPQITICKDETETLEYLKNTTSPQELVLIKGERKFSLDKLTESFHDSVSHNQCFINLAAIAANLANIRKILPTATRVMVMVKALAYGTDDIQMAKFLAKCQVDILGVSYVDEGIALKRAGVKQAIFSLNAAPYEAAKVVKWDLEVGVSDIDFIQLLNQEGSKQKKQVKVHLHINTGMGRFGCRPEEALDLALAIQKSPHLSLEGIMTHFACSDDPQEDAFTYQQIQSFDQVIEKLEHQGITIKWRHAANSGGALRLHLPQYNMVRIGLAVYGLYGSEAMRKALDLRLALSLTSRIVNMTICKKGETVSYKRHYTVERDMQKIAVLPIGYFDGLHRHYSGKAYVLIHGQKAPMVGAICMDYMMIDVTDIPNVNVGDKALIFGEDEFGHYMAPEELAAKGHSIVHELITCLGPRIQRVFIEEEGAQIR